MGKAFFIGSGRFSMGLANGYSHVYLVWPMGKTISDGFGLRARQDKSDACFGAMAIENARCTGSEYR